MKVFSAVLFIGIFSLSVSLNAIAQTAQKRVVIEKFTNSLCGQCPNGSIMINDFVNEFPETIWLAHHKPNEGPLKNVDTEVIWNSIPVYGNPLGMVDRLYQNNTLLNGTNNWRNLLLNQLDEPAYVSVSIDELQYHQADRSLIFNCHIQFETLPEDGGPYRLTAFMVEDSVWGVPQKSYFSDVPGHPLEGLGEEIWNYPHRNVVRNILENPWGIEGVIPENPIIGNTYTHSFGYQIPEDFVAERMHIVCLVSKHIANDQSNYQVYNADKKFLREKTTLTNVAELESSHSLFTSFPSPASNLVSINFSILPNSLKLLDASGKVLEQFSALSSVMELNLSAYSNGLYFILAERDGEAQIEKLLIFK